MEVYQPPLQQAKCVNALKNIDEQLMRQVAITQYKKDKALAITTKKRLKQSSLAPIHTRRQLTIYSTAEAQCSSSSIKWLFAGESWIAGPPTGSRCICSALLGKVAQVFNFFIGRMPFFNQPTVSKHWSRQQFLSQKNNNSKLTFDMKTACAFVNSVWSLKYM